MRNSVLSILFFVCSMIHLCAVFLCTKESQLQTFIVCMGLFFIVCTGLFSKIGDDKKEVDRKIMERMERMERMETPIETFLSKSEKKAADKAAAKKKAAKKAKDKEGETKTTELLQKSKNALSITESESSSVDDIKKAVADTKTFADECSVIVSAIKTTKTSSDAATTRSNAEKAVDALKARLASDEAKRPKGVPNIYFVQISSVIGQGINVVSVDVFDDKGIMKGLKCDPKTTGPYRNEPNRSCQFALDQNTGTGYYSHDNQDGTMIINLNGPKAITKVTVENTLDGNWLHRIGSARIELLDKEYKPIDTYSTTLLPGRVPKQTVKYYNTEENKPYDKPLSLAYI